MFVLPDYIVLDFLEWISQNYPRNNGFLGPLLYDEKIAMSYAEKYLHREYGGSKVYGYKQCKKQLKRYINRVIIMAQLSRQKFDVFIMN